MSDKKTTHMHDGERKISAETAHMLSKEQTAYDKSEQKNYAMEDKRRVAREEHTNGSTPKNKL
jgi:hypothetical protein